MSFKARPEIRTAAPYQVVEVMQMFQSVKRILAWYDEGKLTEKQLAVCLQVRELAVLALS